MRTATARYPRHKSCELLRSRGPAARNSYYVKRESSTFRVAMSMRGRQRACRMVTSHPVGARGGTNPQAHAVRRDFAACVSGRRSCEERAHPFRRNARQGVR